MLPCFSLVAHRVLGFASGALDRLAAGATCVLILAARTGPSIREISRRESYLHKSHRKDAGFHLIFFNHRSKASREMLAKVNKNAIFFQDYMEHWIKGVDLSSSFLQSKLESLLSSTESWSLFWTCHFVKWVFDKKKIVIWEILVWPHSVVAFK